MTNDGFVKLDDVMPFLSKNLTYWNRYDIYEALQKMPIITLESRLSLFSDLYIRKSEIMLFLLRYISFWKYDEVSNLITSMYATNGLMVKISLLIDKYLK